MFPANEVASPASVPVTEGRTRINRKTLDALSDSITLPVRTESLRSFKKERATLFIREYGITKPQAASIIIIRL